MSRRVVSTSIFIACALLLAVNGQPALANANPNPGVAPIESHPFGMAYGQWNAGWWQWLFSVPATKNPELADSGPVDCSVGQSGSVWFLASTFVSGQSITRSCTVPAGKALFVPIINSWADNVCFTPPLSVGELRALAASLVDSAVLHASIDGRSLTNLESYRAISPVFSYTLPPSPDNVLAAVFGVSLPDPSCWPSLTVTPAVADGFYIMLTPLTPGTHIINFGGSSSSGSSIDVTYNLTVK